MNHPIFPNRLLCLILLILAGALSVCLGQEENTEPIQYRQWLAPLDSIEDWPYGPGRYLPIDRKVFEQWTELLKKTSEQTKQEKTSRFTRIVLEAKLDGRQLSRGKGFFELRNGILKQEEFIPLDPWGLWIDSPSFEDGTPVSLMRGPDEKIQLRLPADEDLTSKRIKFLWSLRCRNDVQGDLSFDFVLPPSAAVELLLDLPISMIPGISTGIIMEPKAIPQEELQDGELANYRRWRILPGRNAKMILTITPDENRNVVRQKTAIQQTIQYRIMQKGTDVTAKIYFDKSDTRLNELLVDLEAPLRAADVRYGERAISWSQFASEDVSEKKAVGTRIHIDLSETAKDEPGELTIDAVCPVHEEQPWALPRIRVVSPNVFWKDTRCGVHIQSPLLIQNIFCERAVQVTPRNPIDRIDWEQFVFQYFEDDSIITVDFAPYIPRVNLNSAVQIQWGSNEIRGNMTVDCNVADGELYTLDIPISPHWTIDSVRCDYWTLKSTKVSGADEIQIWDVINAGNSQKKPNLLSIQFKHPQSRIRLRLTGRFHAGSQDNFRLGDVFPLVLPNRSDENHYIAVAVQSTIPYHLQYRSQNHSAFEIPNADSRLTQRFIDTPSGTVFPMNVQTQELRFSVERLKPNYTAEIIGNVLLREKEIIPTFRFRCQPVDSSVDRIYVHFIPGYKKNTVNENSNEKTNGGIWTWSANSESIQPLQTRRLSPKEQQELLPYLETLSEPQRLAEDITLGETWEVRLTAPQTTPFELRAAATVPLPDLSSESQTELMPIPFAALPMAIAQKGEIYIESPKIFQYHVVNFRLKSIPIPPTEWYRYQEIRAAFRYEPAEEIRMISQSPQQFPLSLHRYLAPEEAPASAWIWSLRLDTQYESEGIVKDNAIFLLENRGKDSLRIRLPNGIYVGNVHAVWRDDQRITWHPDNENNSDRIFERIHWSGNVPAKLPPLAEKSKQNIVVVSLPEGTRFVSISLEYSHEDIPLTGQRKLEPQYPSADVQILSGNWTLWLPPEFDVSLRRSETTDNSNRSFLLSEAMNNLLQKKQFDPFSITEWKELMYKKSRHHEAETASQIFFNWIAAGLTENNGLQSSPGNNSVVDLAGNLTKGFLSENTAIRNGFFQTESDSTWATILGNEKKLLEMLGVNRSNGVKGIDAKILIDKQSLVTLGITPATLITLPETDSILERGSELFERNGLVLLVSSKIRPDSVKEYTFYITSFLASSLHRQFSSESIDNCSRYVPETVDVTHSSSELPGSLEQSLTGFSRPQWTPLANWIKETSSLSMPWSISPQIVRLASITPDWYAFELPKGSDESLYVVHHGTFLAYHWLAFLLIVVLTARKPFSSPIFLIALLILFEILARLVAPCYIEIPSGAFLGAAVSLGFGLVRSKTVTETIVRFRRFQRLSGSTDIPQTELTNTKPLPT